MNKDVKNIPGALLLLLASLLIWAGPAEAVEKAVVRDLVVANSSRDLLLYFQVGEIFRAGTGRNIGKGGVSF